MRPQALRKGGTAAPERHDNRLAPHARARATRLAAAQGVKLSTVFAITENAGFGNLAGDFGFGGGQVSYGRMEKMTADSGMAGALLAPKQITLQKSVNVIYKLNP